MSGPQALPFMQMAAARALPYIQRVTSHPLTKRTSEAASKQAGKMAQKSGKFISETFVRGSMPAGSTHPPGTASALRMIAVNELWGGGVGGQVIMRNGKPLLRTMPPPEGSSPSDYPRRRAIWSGPEKPTVMRGN